ncbi:hypothetical protein C1H46_005092 [Malus baccata]|uniref:Uncharacterized protein n=1 Tax=Malus baccata TaxID=106549 RepID=A0A540NDN7_MALBA|nr:hypothetical protein C1H46_005092 [Malus baccata]
MLRSLHRCCSTREPQTRIEFVLALSSHRHCIPSLPHQITTMLPLEPLAADPLHLHQFDSPCTPAQTRPNPLQSPTAAPNHDRVAAHCTLSASLIFCTIPSSAVLVLQV